MTSSHLYGVMQHFTGGVQGEIMEGRDDGFGPAVGRRPLNLEHVVAELSAEHQGVGVGLGAPLLATALRDLQVRRLRKSNIHVHVRASTAVMSARYGTYCMYNFIIFICMTIFYCPQ